MNNTELYAAYHESLENGNTAEVLRLANLVDFVAIADAEMLANPMPKPEKNFKFSVPQGFDYENAILARDERNNMDI